MSEIEFPVFEKRLVYVGNGDEQSPRQENKFTAIVNTETEETVGMVTPRYELLQHAELYEKYQEAIAKSDVPIEKESVQFKKNGSRMFLAAKLQKEYSVQIQDSRIDYGLTIINSVNGSARLMILPYTFRVLCENQVTHKDLAMAQKIRHCSIIKNTVENLDQAIRTVTTHFETITTVYENWTTLKVDFTQEILSKYNIPLKYSEPILKENPETAWDLFNMLTDLNTHDEQRNVDSRFNFDRTIEKLMAEVVVKN